jgi:hypothetical protein
MAFVRGQASRLYVAEHAWSAYTTGWSFTKNITPLETTVLSDEPNRSFILGQSSGSMSIDMNLDALYATSSQFALLNSWQSASQVVTVGPSGFSAGAECWMVDALDAAAAVQSAVAGLVTANITLTPTGNIDAGRVIGIHAAITSDTDGATYDGGAASANGGVAHLHVTAYSGLTSDSVIVEHSTNDSVWATLGTFASVTAIGAERLVIAPGTTVNRYLRVRDDVTGTGSISRIVAFSRR